VDGGNNERPPGEGGSPGRWSVLEASRPSLTGRGGELRGRRPGSAGGARGVRAATGPAGREVQELEDRRFIAGTRAGEILAMERVFGTRLKPGADGHRLEHGINAARGVAEQVPVRQRCRSRRVEFPLFSLSF